jgi:hypothetical protein
MGLAELQQALARLSIDPVFRERFFTDPTNIGGTLGLSESESQNLARIPRRQIEQFAESLVRKRRDQVRRAIPITARILGDRFDDLFTQFVIDSAPRGSTADLNDAAEFVAAISRRPEGIEPPWSVDHARYELAWRQAVQERRVLLVRRFRFAVARMASGQMPDSTVLPQAALAFWWRLSRRAPIRHFVLSVPRLRGRRK